MPNDDTINVEYDTNGVTIPDERNLRGFREKLSEYLYPKLTYINNRDENNDIEFSASDIERYGLEESNGRINIVTTNKLINYLKSFVKKNINDVNEVIGNHESSISELGSKVSGLEDVIDIESDSLENYINNSISNSFGILDETLDDKADINHTHNISDVNSLDNTLNTLNDTVNSKANSVDLSNHINDKSNPHQTTLEQLGVIDSGWIRFNVTNSAMKHWSGQELEYRKIGNIVHMRGAVTSDGKLYYLDGVYHDEPDLGKIVGTLPVGFRPSKTERVRNQASYQNTHLVLIKPNGDVHVAVRYGTTSAQSTIDGGCWLNCYATFFVD